MYACNSMADIDDALKSCHQQKLDLKTALHALVVECTVEQTLAKYFTAVMIRFKKHYPDSRAENHTLHLII